MESFAHSAAGKEVIQDRWQLHGSSYRLQESEPLDVEQLLKQLQRLIVDRVTLCTVQQLVEMVAG